MHDIVRWAREQGILCQGRGSAANSVVCFCLGVTAVDPTEQDHDMLFARFISRERDEPPDIDVDFEHERRELVMQYVYERYGRERAAICATVIHYRPRSAIRDVGKALGLTEDVTAALAGTVWGSWGDGLPDEHIRQAGLDPESPDIRRATTLATAAARLPAPPVAARRRLRADRAAAGRDRADRQRRHAGPHLHRVGQGRHRRARPDEGRRPGAGHAHRDQAGDRHAGHRRHGRHPARGPGRPTTCSPRPNSVGVFQVESRAQMSMLPRMKPSRFYDLVIEVAIVRPGPIQGDMVHPYLRRREGSEPVNFPSPSPEHGPADELSQVLGKTLGVPLFQEQAMRLAIEAAKFTPEEANGLRRAMATFRHYGDVGVYGAKFVDGMVNRGYDPEFAQRCFNQIEGFGSYGFPESHAISFAKLVYVSAWIKCRHPDVFCAALLNSQPMGFYQPAQLVRDAREHGVEVREPDVLCERVGQRAGGGQSLPPPQGEGRRSREGAGPPRGCERPAPGRNAPSTASRSPSPEGKERGDSVPSASACGRCAG